MVKKLTDRQVAIMQGKLTEEIDGWYVNLKDNRFGPFVDGDMALNYLNMVSGTSDKLTHE